MKATTTSSTTGNPPFARPLRRDRRGVALILVLGMMAILLITAVTFAVSMRTERAAALFYANNVRAHQLVYAGLARALEQIRLDMSANAKVYPAWDAQSSFQWRTNMALITNLSYMWSTSGTFITANMTNCWSSSNPIFIAETLPFFPAGLTGSVDALDKSCMDPAVGTYTYGTYGTNTWIYYDKFVMSTVSNVTGGWTTNLLCLGRVSYLIVNCSGLLDANLAGGAARGMGASPAEIALGNLPEFSVGGQANFVTQRAIDKRYEMLDELAALNLLPGYNQSPSNFATYSGAPQRYLDTNTVPATIRTNLYLSDTVAGLMLQRPAILSAFSNAFSQAELAAGGYGGFSIPDILYWNLLDYVDTNSLPNNDIYCVESAPCFSEIVRESVVSAVDVGGGNWLYTVQPTFPIEMFAPLSINPSTQSFDLAWSVSYVGYPSAFTVVGATNWASVTTNYTPGVYEMVPAMPGPRLEFTSPLPPTWPLSYTIQVALALSSGPVPVDVLTQPIQFPVTHAGVGAAAVASAEAQDPRFNAYSNSWVVRAGDSRGTTNLATINYLANPANQPCDSNVVTFVANRPLQVVGELGYLAYDKGRTVRLCGPNLHRVVDTFTLRTNAFMRGLVNPNSRQSAVLAAVYDRMPLDRYPGGPVSTTITSWVANDIARAATNFLATTTNEFRNGSDIGKVDYFSALDDLTRESFVRNSAGLFSPGQNLFTILVEAQASPGGIFNVLPPRQRAVALVWRDPYTGEFVIRSLKWLMY